MQLPGALFEEIIGTLNGRATAAAFSSSPSDAADRAACDIPSQPQRRRDSRLGVQARVTLIPLTDHDTLSSGPLTVPLRDLSAGGLGFLHGGTVALDEQFVVLLPHGHAQKGDSVAVLCQVAYYQPLAERVYAVGARFVR